MKWFVAGPTVVALGLLSRLALAQVESRPDAIRPARFENAPSIDGHLDDLVWSHATSLREFRQVHPGDNLEPSQHTEVLIGYDQRALYLAFRAEDSSGHVRATLARRDAIDDDDVIGVYLDTFHDRRRAYYIFFNPYGIQADGIYTEGQARPDLTVDLVIDSKGTVDATGYTVEAAIPFASLRYRSGGSPVWGLHVQRFIRRDRNEQISWRALSRDRSSPGDEQEAQRRRCNKSSSRLTVLTNSVSPTVVPPGVELRYWAECVIGPMVLGAPFMLIATLMAVRAFPTRPAIAGALSGLSAGMLTDAGWRLSCWISEPSHVIGSHGLAMLGLAAAGALLAVAIDWPRWKRLRSGT